MDSFPLCMKDLNFYYDSSPILKNITYNFRSNKLTVICGPNGAGKSSLLNLAAGHLRGHTGSVTLQGKNILTVPAKKRAQQMALLPQTSEAPSELQVKELVTLGRYAWRKPLSPLSEQDEIAINDGIAATHMTEFVDRPLAELSGGQRQRAWIAMILAQQAPIMLLDEPTNHLDSTHANEIMKLLTKFVKEQGKTVIVILHDINLMARYADDVLLLKDGDIFRSGPFESTVTPQNMSALYDSQAYFGFISAMDRPFIMIE